MLALDGKAVLSTDVTQALYLYQSVLYDHYGINIEKLLDKKVYLKIFVKHDPRWKDSENFLNSYN